MFALGICSAVPVAPLGVFGAVGSVSTRGSAGKSCLARLVSSSRGCLRPSLWSVAIIWSTSIGSAAMRS